MREFSLSNAAYEDGRKETEKFLFLTTEATDEAPWGEFEPLRGTSWAQGIGVVSGETMSHALHGFLQPLLRELGRSPHASGRRVLQKEGECGARAGCPTWAADLCRPGGRGTRKGVVGPPVCYEPPLAKGSTEAQIKLFQRVALAWKEDRYTIVIEGEGFVLK